MRERMQHVIETDPHAGFFQEATGIYSSMRLMAFLSLLVAILA